MTLRLALIGAGRIARLVHLPVLASLPGARLVAVADPDEGALTTARRLLPGLVTVRSLEEVLARPDIDAVVLCVPTGMHAASAIQGFRAGKHVYVEKPLALSAADATAVRDAWRQAGTIGMMGFNFRRHPRILEAVEALDAGTVGQVLAIRSIFTVAPRVLPEWKRVRTLGGGVLLDLASHHIDLARLLSGAEFATVHATLQSVRSPEDTASIHATLTNGATFQGIYSFTAIDDHRLEVIGTRARLRIDRVGMRQTEVTTAPMTGDRLHRAWATLTDLHPARLWATSGEPSFRASLLAFVAAVESSSPLAPDIDDGWRSLEVVLAAESSARTGMPVTVPQAESTS